MKTSSLIFLFCFWISNASAENTQKLDSASKEALSKTQQLMNDPKLRTEAIKGNSNAQWVDQQVQSISGSAENTQAIYELASDIFETLVHESGGDPVKMTELLQKVQKNPEALAGKLTPAQIQKLKSISDRIPATAVKPNSPQ